MNNKNTVLKKSEERYRLMLESANDAIFIISKNMTVEYLNKFAAHLLQCKPEEAVGKKLDELFPCSSTRQKKTLQKVLRIGKKLYTETELEFQDKKFWLGTNFIPMKNNLGEIDAVMGISRDITGRKEAEEELGKEKEFCNTLLMKMKDGFAVIDVDGNQLFVNEEMCRITGYSAKELLSQKPPYRYWAEEGMKEISEAFNKTLSGTEGEYELIFKKKNGERFIALVNPKKTEDASGKVIFFATVKDITQHKKVEERVEYMAYYDLLTGLPNRKLFKDRFSQALKYANRNNQMTALLFLDIDGFKVINDTFGHDTGDKLLKSVAKRLSKCVREMDTVARLGGDEFAVVLPKINESHDAAKVARKILGLFSKYFYIDKRKIFVTASIGISIYPQDGKVLMNLMSNADLAMYYAKGAEKNNFHFFTQKMQRKISERLRLENGLRKAIQKNALLLYYQPVVNLKNGQVTAIEALLRWRHDNGKLSSADEFIHLAELTVLINQIGEWVLNKACRQNKDWQADNGLILPVSVNFSAHQLEQVDSYDVINKILKRSQLDPHYLEIEITEGVLLERVEHVNKLLDKFVQMGIRIVLDDFGTSYSSLNSLKNFPIKKIKIYRQFVQEMLFNAEAKAIVSAVINMAHSLDIDVVAEGIETKGQLAFLKDLDCDEAQGFYFSAPLPADQFEQLLVGNTKLRDVA